MIWLRFLDVRDIRLGVIFIVLLKMDFCHFGRRLMRSLFRDEVAQSVLLPLCHAKIMLCEDIADVYLRYVGLVSLYYLVELRECTSQHAPDLGVDTSNRLCPRLSIARSLDGLSDSLLDKSHLLKNLVLYPLRQRQSRLLLPLELLFQLFCLLYKLLVGGLLLFIFLLAV